VPDTLGFQFLDERRQHPLHLNDCVNQAQPIRLLQER
jgi:hypothetical protein